MNQVNHPKKSYSIRFQREGEATTVGSLIMLLACAILLGVMVTTVSAHAALIRSEPEDGETVEKSPEQVIAWFSQELDSDLSSLRVFDAGRNQVDNGDGGVDLNDLDHLTMAVNLRPLPAGTYTVQWTATSAEDRDTSNGEFRFSVGGEAIPDETTMPPPNNSMTWFTGSVAIVIGLIVLAWIILGRRKRLSSQEGRSAGEQSE